MTSNKNIEIVGLKDHLDQSRHEHYDNGYDDFISMIERSVNKTNMARMFGVSRRTMTKWLYLHYKEGKK